MSALPELTSTFGTTGLIALLLSLFFAAVATVNAWRRRRSSAPPVVRAGPIHMSDPHTGTPVKSPPAFPAELKAAPPPPAPAPAPAPPEKPREAPAAAKPQFFRQLDARGVDVETTRTTIGKHDDYIWE